MSDNLIVKFPATNGEPKVGYPGGWTVIGGEPVAQAWRYFTSADGNVFSGRWTCSKGKFTVVYEKIEFCHVISGSCRITPEGGEPITLKAGDAFVMQPGFKGEWEILEDMTKHFVFA